MNRTVLRPTEAGKYPFPPPRYFRRIAGISLLFFSFSIQAKEQVLPKLPPLIPPAPFVKLQQAESREFLPEIKGNSITAGNKILQIHANGSLSLVTGNEVEHFAMNFRSKRGWVSPEHALESTLNFDPETKTFTTISDYPLDREGNSFPYTQKVALQADGRVKVTVHWDVPDEWQGTVEQFGYYISWPNSCDGRNIRVAGKDYSVKVSNDSKAPPFLNFWIKDKEEEFELFPDIPELSFKFTPLNSRSVLFLSKPVYGGTVNFRCRVFFNKNQTEPSTFSFLLDFRKATEMVPSAQTRGNVDFWAGEALELPDFSISRNLIPNPSFEQGFSYYSTYEFCHALVLDGNWAKNWEQQEQFFLDDNEAANGKHSLRIGANNLFIYANTVVLEPGTYTFSFYAKCAPDKNTSLSVRFPPFKGMPRSAIIGQWNKKIQLSPWWNRYLMTFQLKQAMPVSPQFQVVDSSMNDRKMVWIDALQLEKGETASEYTSSPIAGKLVTSAEGNFLKAGNPISARLAIFTTKPHQAGDVTVSVKDFFGEQLFQQTFPFTSDKLGNALVHLPLDGKLPRGIFVLKAKYLLADGTKTHDFHRLSIMDFLEGKHRLREIFAESYGAPENHQGFKKYMKRFRDLGLGAKPHLTTWDKEVWDTYKEFDVTPFNTFMLSYLYNTDRKIANFCITENYMSYVQCKDNSDFLENALYSEIRVEKNDPLFLIRDFNLDASGELTDKYLKKLENVASNVARSHRCIKLWGLGGELISKFHGGWWSKEGTADQIAEKHARLLAAFVKGVKQGNPQAKVFQDVPGNMMPNGGIAETDHLLARTNELGVKFDVIGIHIYRASPEDPDLDADTQELLKVLKKRGYDNAQVFWPEGMLYGPYNIPQWGVDRAKTIAWYRRGPLSYDMGWTEKLTAAWRARTWLVALKYQNRVTCVQSGATSSLNYNFEMDLDLTPYATQKISNTLARLLGNAYFKADIRFAPYIRVYIFEDEYKRPVAAVWCHHPDVDAGKLPAPVVKANFIGNLETIFDLMEVERKFTPDPDGQLNFAVSSFPTFYRGKPGSLEDFSKIFKEASLLPGDGFAPITVSANPVAPDKASLVIKNYVSQEFTGKIEYANNALAVQVLPAETGEISCALPMNLSYNKITEENLAMTISSNQGIFSTDASFKGFLCPKVKGKITIDGELDDWTEYSPILFTNRIITRSRETGITQITDEDFSGWFKVAWSSQGLYLAVKIVDDHFIIRDIHTPSRRWNNDSLQVYFDSLCDARSRSANAYDDNDYDYAIHPHMNGKTAEIYRRFSPDPQLGLGVQAPANDTIASDIPVAFNLTSNGYVYEVFFPARYLLPLILKKGSVVGIGLLVNDRDELDNGDKYGWTKSALTLAPSGIGCYTKPKFWPAMLLWD